MLMVSFSLLRVCGGLGAAGLKLDVGVGKGSSHHQKQPKFVQKTRFWFAKAWVMKYKNEYALQRALAASNNMRSEGRGAANVQNISNADHEAHNCR